MNTYHVAQLTDKMAYILHQPRHDTKPVQTHFELTEGVLMLPDVIKHMPALETLVAECRLFPDLFKPAASGVRPLAVKFAWEIYKNACDRFGVPRVPEVEFRKRCGRGNRLVIAFEDNTPVDFNDTSNIESPLASFVNDCCLIRDDLKVHSVDLYEAYRRHSAPKKPFSHAEFSRFLNRDFQVVRRSVYVNGATKAGFLRIGLKPCK